jgi:cell division protease FtsH
MGVPLAPPESGRDESAGEGLLKTVLIGAAILAVLYFVLKKINGGGVGGNVFELKKTKARPLEAASQVRFDQVGGNTEAVEALKDVVDFMKDPTPWKAMGARVPRGILLVGPPGTGKTLMARAVAGETNASFFYTSATEFVEMFVGVGAARVRDTFEKAAKAQPAVIFIDEIDAIGRKRSSGMGTMHEEREQTLNQLLVLMDGLERFDRLVVIAATNRPDVLDPALMRSGRFDRIIRMVRPADIDRAAILAIHMKQKPMERMLTADQLVPHTQGLTGADIETVLNEAAILAIRRSRSSLSPAAAIGICEQDVIDSVARLKHGNRQFNTLDSVIVESVTQLSEPTGRAVARITTSRGQVMEGDIIWMNAQFVKLKLANSEERVLARENIEQIEAMDGTEMSAVGDTTADRWTRPNLDVG